MKTYIQDLYSVFKLTTKLIFPGIFETCKFHSSTKLLVAISLFHMIL